MGVITALDFWPMEYFFFDIWNFGWGSDAFIAGKLNATLTVTSQYWANLKSYIESLWKVRTNHISLFSGLASFTNGDFFTLNFQSRRLLWRNFYNFRTIFHLHKIWLLVHSWKHVTKIVCVEVTLHLERNSFNTLKSVSTIIQLYPYSAIHSNKWCRGDLFEKCVPVQSIRHYI